LASGAAREIPPRACENARVRDDAGGARRNGEIEVPALSQKMRPRRGTRIVPPSCARLWRTRVSAPHETLVSVTHRQKRSFHAICFKTKAADEERTQAKCRLEWFTRGPPPPRQKGSFRRSKLARRCIGFVRQLFESAEESRRLAGE
jgi:hypothetical protein